MKYPRARNIILPARLRGYDIAYWILRRIISPAFKNYYRSNGTRKRPAYARGMQSAAFITTFRETRK